MSIGGFTTSPDPRYKFLRALGSGSYGAVAAFRDSETGKDVAMKRIAQVFDDFMVCRRTLREVKVMRHFSHPNLLHLVDVLPVEVQKSQVFVVTPLMDCDLDVMIRKKGVRLSAVEVCNFLVQMLLGLLHLHSGHVIHRDLKPANIFVRKDGLVKIGDLGLSRGIDLEDESGEPLRPAEEALTEYVVTRWYRAPEVILLPAEYGPPVDVWSVGCILYEMVTGKVLFQGRSSFDQLRRIVSVLGTPKGKAADWLRQCGAAKRMLQQLPDSPPRLQKLREDWHVRMADTVKDLLQEMLAFDPDARPSLEDALELPCLADAMKDRGVAEAKSVSVFQQEYDKEFDALDRVSERRLLPKVARMLQAEISSYRGEDPSTRRRTVTPPRSSVSASTAARRTPPRTAASDNRRRASSGQRLSVPDADTRLEPRATSSDTKKEPRASSGPRVSMLDVDTRREVRRMSMADGENKRDARIASGNRLSVPDGDSRMAARSSSAQRLSLPAGHGILLSARSSRTGVGGRENHCSDRASDPADEHPMIDMAAIQRQGTSRSSTNPMSARRKVQRGQASDIKDLYSWAKTELDDEDDAPDAPVFHRLESSAPPCGPPPLSEKSRPSSAPRFSARGLATKASAPFSAAARGEKVEGSESRSRVSSAPRVSITETEELDFGGQNSGFRGVEAWAAVPQDDKRDALLAARAEAARRERERAENRKQAEDTRVQEPERFLREVGLEMQQRQRRRASGSDVAGKDTSIHGLRAARDEAVRRELQRKTVAAPSVKGGRVEDEEVMRHFLKGLRQ